MNIEKKKKKDDIKEKKDMGEVNFGLKVNGVKLKVFNAFFDLLNICD